MPALVRRASSINYERLFEHGRQQSFKKLKKELSSLCKDTEKSL